MEEISVICRNEDETVAFAQKLSQIAKVGDTFALFGTLGMGKSVFARGFVPGTVSIFCRGGALLRPTKHVCPRQTEPMKRASLV